MKRILVLFPFFIFLYSCAHHGGQAPIVDIQVTPQKAIERHVVTPGETLYSIALTYDLDYRILSKINSLDKNYAIVPGQVLSLNVKDYVEPKPQKQEPNDNLKVVTDTLVKVANGVVDSFKSQTVTASKKPSKSEYSAKIKWSWPIKGKVLVPFKGNNGLNKGIDIRGKLGESIYAAAAGEVIYAGGGLREYGKLIILKHGDEFLSAYAHNRVLSVSEGDLVKAGEKIAEIGYSGATKTAKLHFEIRVRGKPVDPMKYLPRI